MVYRPRSLLERLELLRQYGADLSQWGSLSLDDYLAGRTTRYAVERLLFLIAGNVLDVLDHVLSARHEVVSDNLRGDPDERAPARPALCGSLRCAARAGRVP